MVILLLMLASVNQLQKTQLIQVMKGILFSSAGSEESIERSEGMGEVIDANLDGIRKVLNRSVS